MGPTILYDEPLTLDLDEIEKVMSSKNMAYLLALGVFRHSWIPKVFADRMCHINLQVQRHVVCFLVDVLCEFYMEYKSYGLVDYRNSHAVEFARLVLDLKVRHPELWEQEKEYEDVRRILQEQESSKG